MASSHIARWILIVGLAFIFIFFGIDKFVHPLVWIGWLPTWMDGLLSLSKNTWLQIFAVTEILIGSMLIFPMYHVQRAGAVLAVLHLCGVLTQTGWNDIAVRDVGLLAAAVALWFMPKK